MKELHQLFSSKTRVRILTSFFIKEEKIFYQAELQENSPISVVQYELKKLVRIGIIKNRSTKSRVCYFLNKEHDLYLGLKIIFRKKG